VISCALNGIGTLFYCQVAALTLRVQEVEHEEEAIRLRSGAVCLGGPCYWNSLIALQAASGGARDGAHPHAACPGAQHGSQC
jgi:hypothetical protein